MRLKILKQRSNRFKDLGMKEKGRGKKNQVTSREDRNRQSQATEVRKRIPNRGGEKKIPGVGGCESTTKQSKRKIKGKRGGGAKVGKKKKKGKQMV